VGRAKLLAPVEDYVVSEGRLKKTIGPAAVARYITDDIVRRKVQPGVRGKGLGSSTVSARVQAGVSMLI
jgi:hypothetical protein